MEWSRSRFRSTTTKKTRERRARWPIRYTSSRSYKLVDLRRRDPACARSISDLAFTNSHLAMTVAFALVVLFLTLVTANAKVVPGRTQAAGETLFGMIDGLVNSIIGHDGRKLFPFVFTIFTFILAMNFLGLFLSFTATSQIAVTATFGVITILLVLAIGFGQARPGLLQAVRPVGRALAGPAVRGDHRVRLVPAAPGHPDASSVRQHDGRPRRPEGLRRLRRHRGVGGAVGLAWACRSMLLSLGMTIGLTALEFLVAFLQAFVFAVLTAIYLNDVVNLGHGH